MLTELLPFQCQINPVAIAGAGLWATGFYLGMYSFSQWIAGQLSRWFSFAERSLYLSTEEYERTRSNREAQNDFWGSILSIVPFLILGGLCEYACLVGLENPSWGISLGIIVCMSGAIYELGRRDGESRK